MGRRSRETNGEALIKLAAMLPWWLALALAPLSYVTLHALASGPVVMPAGVGSIPVVQMLFKALATAGQFIAPLIFLVGGVVSLVKQSSRKKLFEQVAARPEQETINSLSWREFERLIGEAFRRKGFSVSETGQSGPDGGVDLELRQGRELHLVQCKQWRAQRVGVSVVRELAGVMAARGAAGGFVVTSGTYTPDAEAFARGSNITLIGGAQLTSLIAQARTTPVDQPRQQMEDAPPRMQVVCPVCKRRMVKRLAKKGPDAGRHFWGCSNFPVCRGTLGAD